MPELLLLKQAAQLHALVMVAAAEQRSPIHPILHALPVHLKQLNASNQDCKQGKVGVGSELGPTSKAQDHDHGILINCFSNHYTPMLFNAALWCETYAPGT